jgi:hypothetical protein
LREAIPIVFTFFVILKTKISMKTFFRITLIVTFLVLGLSSVDAQKSLNEGHIQYEVTNIESESMEAQMMKGTLIDIFFNQANTKMNIQMMGGMITMDVITETATESTTLLMNMMGRKVQVDQTEKKKEEAKVEKPEFDITYDKSDIKEIAGEKCIKATLVDKKTNDSIIMYVAKKLNPMVKMAQDMFPGLEGLPLEIILASEGIGVTITAQTFEKKVEKTAFDIPEGYEIMTPEKFEKEMGGMMDLGF